MCKLKFEYNEYNLENRLRWFEHLQKRNSEHIVKINEIRVKRNRRRTRQKGNGYWERYEGMLSICRYG